jgi:hypothetical protein
MTRVEQLLEQSERCARELADALRMHADQGTLEALEERLKHAQDSWHEEVRRVSGSSPET